MSKYCIVLSIADATIKNYLSLVDIPVRAGFPSSADDYLETKLDLTEHLVKQPSATYYIKVAGDSMIGYGISNGDLLIVDRALEPNKNKSILCKYITISSFHCDTPCFSNKRFAINYSS
ncbi:LexA family protein [Gilliamella sp. Pas-s25]|uniref:LexA family protein n=1 Tax=Gilliamella sp. Pas-s25 TaxID=2687310 RepID=UPI00135E19F4|nr:S24 family peptidase [Gilliamella sp. Pas-s25]MWP61545.1 hypothetical protein [Gilliamella sp. Pas-s25]